MDLTFENVPLSHESAFAEGVLATLEALDYSFDFDETSPPNSYKEVTYKIFGVRPAQDA
jgi:hypothetical protein